jgi:ATP-binding cassette subfamily B (MDR/TAP) protein 1
MSAFAAGQTTTLKMYEIIKRKPSLDDSEVIGKILDDINGDIEFNNVSFGLLTLLNEQIYLVDSCSISQLAKLELWLDKTKARSQQLSVL